LSDGKLFVDQVRSSSSTILVSVLLHGIKVFYILYNDEIYFNVDYFILIYIYILLGPTDSGKTALAARMAMSSEFPFIKLISPENMVGYSESAKVVAINKVFYFILFYLLY
jgi:vesicle-fusing ATPase